jgi:hypothetical protein
VEVPKKHAVKIICFFFWTWSCATAVRVSFRNCVLASPPTSQIKIRPAPVGKQGAKDNFVNIKGGFCL